MRLAPAVRRLAAGLLLLAAGCGADAPPPVGRDPDVAALLERLDRLSAALQTQGPPPAAARDSATTATSTANARESTGAERVDAGEPELLRRVELLEAEIGRLQAALRAHSWRRPHEPAPPRNAAAIAPLVEQVNGDERAKAAVRSRLFGLDEQQILQQLGVPDEAYAQERGVRWEYTDGEHRLGVVFANGRVISVHD